MRRALTLYAGDLLPGDVYDEHFSVRRHALRGSYQALIERLAYLHEGRGEPAQAIEALQMLVASEPTHEHAHVRLMRLWATIGQRQQALAQYAQLKAVLADELDVEPDEFARDLAAAIRSGQIPQPQANEALATSTKATTVPIAAGVPHPLAALIDREQEIEDVCGLLATARLVTLTGPGGIGKTRLAIAVADCVTDAEPDETAFVSLAPIRDPELVLPALAKAPGLQEHQDHALPELVATYLRHRRLLIVLDNFEHVIDAAPALSDLLDQCPHIRVLATSRTRLRLRGEQEFPVPPLRPPEPPPVAALCEYPAVALFVRRAREIQPDFRLTSTNEPVIAEICRRLHGLPLALELAAARSKVLPPELLLARLDRPLELLAGGPRDAPERQQTMRDTIRWSYELLCPAEQRLIHQLSVFAGGWTLEAAEAVVACGTTDSCAVLERLTSLVDNNLVYSEHLPNGATRFGMLEPVREFGLELLESADATTATLERHARYYTTLAAPTAHYLDDPQSVAWVDLLESEHDNFRVALRWTMAAGETGLGLRLAASLWEFWAMRGYLTEGRGWLDDMLAVDVGAMSACRANALRGAGEIAARQGDFAVGARLLTESCAMYRQLDDSFGTARALNGLGLLEMMRNDLAAGRHYLESSLAEAVRIGHIGCVARAQHNLGGIAILIGDYAHADALLTASMELQRSTGNLRGLAYALCSLGVLAHDTGDFARSRLLKEESLKLFTSLGDRLQIATLMGLLGQSAIAEGDLQLAQQRLTESLALSNELSFRPQYAGLVRLLGQVALAGNEPLRAARLFGAAEHMGEVVRWKKQSPATRKAYHQALLELSALVEADELNTAWDQGRQMSIEEAVDYALTPA